MQCSEFAPSSKLVILHQYCIKLNILRYNIATIIGGFYNFEVIIPPCLFIITSERGGYLRKVSQMIAYLIAN